MADEIEPNEERSRADGAARPGGEEEVSRSREREERLTELTDQSLDLLDQLAEARRRVTGLEDAVREADDRRARLEDLLADTRRRVRSTRSLRGLGSPRPAQAVEVVLWTLEAQHDGAWLARAAAALPESATTVLVPGGGDAATATAASAAWNVVAADGRSPAHFANLALSSTDAPLVVLVLSGTDIEAIGAALADGRFDPAGDESVALAQPALVHPDGEVSLGLFESGGLRLRRRALAEGDEAPVPLSFVAPEVVVARRAAHQRLGPFDEDLAGVFAFVEYALRAASRDFQIVGLPGVRVEVPSRALPDRRRDRVRDRLVTLAQHRRGELGAGLGGTELYWQLDPPALKDLLGALLRRIPGAAAFQEGVERLVAEGVGLAGRTISGPALDQRLDEIDAHLAAFDAIPGEPPSEAETELRARAGEVDGTDPASRLYRAAWRLRAAAAAKEALSSALAAARAHADRLEREATRLVEGQLREARERSRRHEERARHLETEATAAKERAYALHEQVAEARAVLRASREELHREREERAEERDVTAARHREDVARIAAALGLDCGPDVAAVLRHVAALRETLKDRERWIVELLRDKGRGLLGRRLDARERTFLDEQDAAAP